ncbi:MAG TPA: hypothetical protein VIS05_01395 [Ilumatobacter sp.]
MSRSDDRGSTSLTTVLLTPVFVVLAFAAFQAAMWTHAVTETRAVARDTAALVARRGARPAVAEASAVAALSRGVDLEHPVVEIIESGLFVVVRITGEAPGIIRGTSAPIEVTEALPLEGFRS